MNRMVERTPTLNYFTKSRPVPCQFYRNRHLKGTPCRVPMSEGKVRPRLAREDILGSMALPLG